LRKVVTPVAAFVVCGLALTMASGARAQGSEPPPAPRDARPAGPVWVPDVVRIDRGQEQRPRVEEDTSGRRRFVAVPPLSIAEDGSFFADGGRIRIAGIRLPERGRICRGEDGRRWTCGVRAHAAFAALIARQRLDCRPVADAASLYDCRAENRSIAEGLIAAGWGEIDPATASPRLVALGRRARTEKVGLWSPDPPPSDAPENARHR